MLTALMNCLLRRRNKTMKEKLEDAEVLVSTMEKGGADDPCAPTLSPCLSIRIPRTASCERCFDIQVVSPVEHARSRACTVVADGDQPVTPDWQCASCRVGGSGRPRCPRFH